MPINQAYFTAGSGGQKYPVHDPPPGVLGLNRLCLRTGASKYGKGVFVMVRGDYDALVTAAGKSAQATLNLTGSPGPGVTINVIIAGSEGLVQSVSSDDSTDMVKVTVYDTRCRNFNPVKKYYNVMQQDFPQSSGKTKCYSSTLNGSSPWSWHDLLKDANLFLEAQIPADIPSWTPYNLCWSDVPFARCCDDVAARLFYVIAFDHQKSTAGNNYGLNLHAPGDSFDENDQTFQQAVLYQTNGSDADRNNYRLPGAIKVCFQVYNADDPITDPYAHRTYEKQVTVGGGSTDIVIPLHCSENVGIWSGGAVANQSDLDAIATDLAGRAFTFISQDFAQYEFPGIWPFRPDGTYRQVEWISDATGARTLVRKDNAKDWSPTDALADPINLVSNQEVVGIGQMNFAISPGGTKVGWGGGSGKYLIPAALSSPAGSGTAGWTYTAKSLDGSITYGTNMTPQRPHWGNTTAGTLGAVYKDNSGNWQLYEALEGRGTSTACA